MTLIAVPLVVAGCGGPASATVTPGSSPPSPTASLPPGTPSETATPEPVSSTGDPDGATLANGRHPAHIMTVDAETQTVTVDVVQFLTGEAAAEAAREDGAPEVPPPNDYWVRNTNPVLRELPVTAGAAITVNTLAGAESGSSAQDVSRTLDELSVTDGLADAVFWLTVEDGQVTEVAEQYLP